MYCRKCGSEMQDDARFCQKCGEQYGSNSPDEKNAEVKQLTPIEERALYVGKNYEKYRVKFDRFDAKDGYVATWHWPCFFFGCFWFAYRRMYLWLLLDVILSIIPYFSFVWWVVRGLLGNYLYWSFLKKKIPEVRANYQAISGSTLDRTGYRAYLITNGGTGNGAVIVIVILIFVAVIGMLAAIAIPNFVRYQQKSKQAEAKVNLKSLYNSETAYFSNSGFYTDDFSLLAQKPVPKYNDKFFYCYYLNEYIGFPDASNALPEGIKPWASGDGYLAVAVGNLDSDPTMDVWTINESGELNNVVDDIHQ